MYKDFKKSESLDTGFIGGSGIVWMFSGIVLGLLVGLGMYYFSNVKNGHAGEAILASEQNTIKKEQFIKPKPQPQIVQTNTASTPSSSDREVESEKEKNKFSYYAVLPNLDVPVTTKAVDTRNRVRVDPPKENKDISSRNNKKSEKSLAPKKGKYFVQIASFKRKKQAKYAVHLLSKRNINASLQKKKIKGRIWYRIVAGPVDKTTVDLWKKKATKLGHKPIVSLIK